jgi:exonuclease VII small subunit
MDELPLFVKLENYDKSVKLIAKSKERLEQVKDLLRRLESLRDKEHEEMKQLEEELTTVESRLMDLHTALKKPEGDTQ